ncbi:MAG: HIT family protein [Candidatus Falkowbacteria bacterium]|nr:HIT family protein [Candidatus Falkowbacteria bacterium]
MSSIFTKIINREVPAHIVWENETHIAFLNIKPINPGHLLVVPKKETGYIFDMSDEDYKEVLMIAKWLAKPLQIATNAKRIGLSVEGFGVDHVHVHLIPINEMNEMDPNREKGASEEELAEMAEKIIKEIESSAL